MGLGIYGSQTLFHRPTAINFKHQPDHTDLKQNSVIIDFTAQLYGPRPNDGDIINIQTSLSIFNAPTIQNLYYLRSIRAIALKIYYQQIQQTLN